MTTDWYTNAQLARLLELRRMVAEARADVEAGRVGPFDKEELIRLVDELTKDTETRCQ